MFTVEHEATIEAPPDEVFSFVDDPWNHVKITPALVDIEEVEALAEGGKRAKYRYKLAGVELTGHVEDAERDPPSRLVQRLSGSVEGTISYEFEPADGGEATRLHYEAEYELPSTVIDTVLAPVAEAYNRREAEATVQNLKIHLEA